MVQWCRSQTRCGIFIAVGWVLASLAGCGGGGMDPTVSEVRAVKLMYGQLARFQVAGSLLTSSIRVESDSCADPAFTQDSGTTLAVLTCQATKVGPMALTFRSAENKLLFQAGFEVPLPQITVFTEKGPFTVELRPDVVKNTVDNFLQYVQNGFYSATLFHRVMPGFVVQAGGYSTGLVKKAGQGAPIALESNKGLSNLRATIAMARTDTPDSATSEFYVNVVDNPALDYQSAAKPGYAVFGAVIDGMAVVDAIAAVPTTTTAGMADVPVTEVKVQLVLRSK